MLFGTLAVIVLGNMLADKPNVPGKGEIRTGQGIIKAGQDFNTALSLI